MLNTLKQSDIDAIIAACGSGETVAAPEETAMSPERERVYALVDDLPKEAQEELLALMWTGGPKNHISFEENLDLARKNFDENHASHIAEQHARLPIYLRDGLDRLSTKQP